MTTDWDNPRPPRAVPGTHRWFKEKLGCDVFDSYRAYCCWDVVGGDPEQIERYRHPGWAFRYFKTHSERLADFGARLESFKKRSFLLRSKAAANGSGSAFGLLPPRWPIEPLKRRQRAPRTRLTARFRHAWQAFWL